MGIGYETEMTGGSGAISSSNHSNILVNKTVNDFIDAPLDYPSEEKTHESAMRISIKNPKSLRTANPTNRLKSKIDLYKIHGAVTALKPNQKYGNKAKRLIQGQYKIGGEAYNESFFQSKRRTSMSQNKLIDSGSQQATASS